MPDAGSNQVGKTFRSGDFLNAFFAERFYQCGIGDDFGNVLQRAQSGSVFLSCRCQQHQIRLGRFPAGRCQSLL